MNSGITLTLYSQKLYKIRSLKDRLMKKYLIGAGVILLCLGCVYLSQKESAKQELITSVVKKGDLVREIEATGEVFAENLVDVGAQASGQIKKLYVKVGDVVKKGDKIADIDAVTQQNKLDQAIAELEILNAKLNSAKIAQKTARIQYEREFALSKSNATSKENLENFTNSLAQAEASLKEIEAQIKQEKIEISTAKTNLGYTNITAPLDGTIVSVPVEVGQTLNASQTTPTVVNIADLDKMQIKMKISEGDIPNLKVGDKVEYSILGDISKKYSGIVDSIDPGLTTLSDGTYSNSKSSSSSSSSSAVYYYAKLKVDNSDGLLRIGMTTQNKIVIEEIKGALSVPTIAVKSDSDGSYVLVKEGEQVLKAAVKIGVSTGIDTQIISGLNEGQIVIVSQLSSEEINKMVKEQKARVKI